MNNQNTYSNEVNSSTSQSINQSALPQPSSVIRDAYSDLQMQLSNLEDEIRRLGGRLEPALAPSKPMPDQTQNANAVQHSPIAESIYHDISVVRSLLVLVAGITERLEL